MAVFSRIVGTGSYLPEKVLTNADLEKMVETNDEWIVSRSGIRERHIAADGETTGDLAFHAATRALEAAGLAAADIELIVLGTTTPDVIFPSTACLVQDRLGANGCPAFDVNAACSGFIYALSIADKFIRTGAVRNALVMGAETLTRMVDWTDRGTCVLFGDGAGAVVVGPSDTPGIGPTVWGSDGTQRDAISQRQAWTDLRESWQSSQADKNVWPAIGMAGQTVFRWAVWGMAPVAQQAIDKAGIKADDLDAFIPHQANIRIIDAMVKQLKLPADIPVARDIVTTANTSAASIPIATTRMLAEKEIPSGGLALQIGFGAGLVYAAQVVVLP